MMAGTVQLSAADWTIIIGAIGAQVVLVIAAIKGLLLALKNRSMVEETHSIVKATMEHAAATHEIIKANGTKLEGHPDG